jgi:hypothetical protein
MLAPSIARSPAAGNRRETVRDTLFRRRKTPGISRGAGRRARLFFLGAACFGMENA